MKQQHDVRARALCAWLLALGMVGSAAAARAEEKESAEHKAQKARATEPKETDIDKAVTIDALLAKGGEKDWSTSKAATIEGTVVQIEKEEDDGDYHISLAPKGGEKDTTRWVIVEVTPAWAAKKPGLARPELEKLRGKTVRVTGWLFHEDELGHPDPRGTNWEIHPVTSIALVK